MKKNNPKFAEASNPIMIFADLIYENIQMVPRNTTNTSQGWIEPQRQNHNRRTKCPIIMLN
jgi:hypothetical protein